MSRKKVRPTAILCYKCIQVYFWLIEYHIWKCGWDTAIGQQEREHSIAAFLQLQETRCLQSIFSGWKGGSLIISRCCSYSGTMFLRNHIEQYQTFSNSSGHQEYLYPPAQTHTEVHMIFK